MIKYKKRKMVVFMTDQNNKHTRQYWLTQLLRIADPVVLNLAADTLAKSMPLYAAKGVTDRAQCTYLEAFGRTLLGLAPWLENPCTDPREEELRCYYADVCRRALRNAVTPGTADEMNFSRGAQPLVDAAFLAQAILRAPTELYEKLDDTVKKDLIEKMRSTRCITPFESNWLLFSAMVEVFLRFAGADWKAAPIDYALQKHLQWYKGDGAYGDGVHFHFDYYNSLVIHPMLCDCLRFAGDENECWKANKELVFKRASRFAGVLEQFINADGSYPVVGRSSCYRFGVFHALSQAALDKNLPAGCAPSQVRCALTAVLKKVLSFEGMFDEGGWLTIGVCGQQPHMGEGYISTGSLYLCTAVFLPLGLPAEDAFWTDAECDWTAKKIWSGEDTQADHSIDF